MGSGPSVTLTWNLTQDKFKQKTPPGISKLMKCCTKGRHVNTVYHIGFIVLHTGFSVCLLKPPF